MKPGLTQRRRTRYAYPILLFRLTRSENRPNRRASDNLPTLFSASSRSPDENSIHTLARWSEANLTEQSHFFNRVRRDMPNSVPTILRGAAAALRRKDYRQCQALCHQILESDPRNAHALHLLGILEQGKGQLSTAEELVRRAIASDPSVADFHNNLGNILAAQADVEQAEAAYRVALRLRPRYAEAHNNFGNVLAKQDRFAEAIDHYRIATSIRAIYPEAECNLAESLRKIGRLEEAAGVLRQVLAHDPANVRSYRVLSLVLKELGDIDGALAALRSAMDLEPTDAQTHLNLAMLLLQSGEFDQGWREYDWRFALHPERKDLRDLPKPLWDGSDACGRTILVRCEQGLGATIQFIRYARVLADLGWKVVVECQPALKGLLQGVGPHIRVLAKGERFPHFDVHAPLLSLPGIVGTGVNTIPAAIPYLFLDPAMTSAWRERFATFNGLKVGIAWQGNPNFAMDVGRSIALRYFLPLMHMPGVRCFNLQRINGLNQLIDLRGQLELVDLGQDLNASSPPFVETAAVMSGLDLVITSDTSIAHLAGALGVPVWVALSSVPDWRWFFEREDCPWYPTMRLFRQKRSEDWEVPFSRMATALHNLME